MLGSPSLYAKEIFGMNRIFRGLYRCEVYCLFFLIVKFIVKFIGFDSQIFPQAASELGQHRSHTVPDCCRNIFKQMPVLSFTSAIEKDFSNDRKWDSVNGSIIGIRSRSVMRFGQRRCALHVIAFCVQERTVLPSPPSAGCTVTP